MLRDGGASDASRRGRQRRRFAGMSGAGAAGLRTCIALRRRRACWGVASSGQVCSFRRRRRLLGAAAAALGASGPGGRWRTAVAAYNSGPARTAPWLKLWRLPRRAPTAARRRLLRAAGGGVAGLCAAAGLLSSGGRLP
eukprot:5191378-Alexandrium_andersonii.AAC.1